MAIVGIKVLLGSLFIAAACLAFLTMLHLLGAPHTAHAKTLRVLHRVGGWVAVVLFVVLSVMCIGGLVRAGAEPPARIAIHLAFAALFVPLLLLKILIIEKYPELRNRLFTVGTVLFATVFILFFTSSLPHLARRGVPESGLEEPSAAEDVSLGRDLFAVKCAKCHRLDRALSARWTPEKWEVIVTRMRSKDLTWMSESEADEITKFLISLGS